MPESRPLEKRVAILEDNMSEMKKEFQETLALIQKNTELTQRVADDTEELRKIWAELRSAFKIFSLTATVIKFFFKVLLVPLLMVYAIIYTWAHGVPPPLISTIIKVLT